MLQFPTPIPFAELLGMRLLRYEGGECEISLDPTGDLLNSWSVVHGGVTMTLLDVCMAHAARSAVQDVRGAATVEMKTSFMRPGVGPQTAKARVLHRTATMAFCEGSVFDEKGEMVSHATGTFKFMRALPSGDRKVHALNPGMLASSEGTP